MPVCYFNADYDTKYRCDYKVNDSSIEITVDYDIEDEIEAVNGVKVFGSNTVYKKRDILIVDFANKMNYLAKNAVCTGNNQVYGSADGGAKTRFRSRTFFVHSSPEKLSQLPITPKVSKIKVLSKVITDWIGHPSLQIAKSKSDYIIKLSKENNGKNIAINRNYIKQIVAADNWLSQRDGKKNNITIDFDGYIELVLTKRVNYDKVYEFVNELLIFLQLYCPNRMSVDAIQVMVDGIYYGLQLPLMEVVNEEEYVETVVNGSLLSFLNTCYTAIPYRNSKTEIRNIPYIVMNTSRSIEDNFLMFYRFIECFYKKTRPSERSKFVSCSINDHYANNHNLSEDQIDKYSQKIICLRNHYVHSGYYIKNSSLRICFEKEGRRKNPKDYTVNNIDIKWIYDRTNILYRISIDIIYREMLGYQEYNFQKHF